MRSWIRLCGIFGLIFILFGLVGGVYFYGDPLFTAAISQLLLGVVLLGIYLFFFFGETVAALWRNREKLLGALGGLFALMLIIGVNVVAHSEFGEVRYDVTKNKIHSLDETTVNILKSLPAEISIISFIQDSRYRKLFENLASRYQYENPKISYRSLDGKKDPRLLKEYGAQENQIVFHHQGTKKNVLLDAGQINEQEFTSAIRRVLGEAGKKIYFATLNPKFGVEDRTETGLYFLKILLEREGYLIESFNPLETPELPKDASLIALVGSTDPVPTAVVDLLKTYADAGGKIFIAQDPIPNANQSDLVASNLNPLLEKFGLQLDNSIIVQLRPALAIQNRGGQAEVVRVGTQRLVRVVGLPDSGHPIVAALGQEVFDFIFAQPVNVLSKKSDQIQTQIITQTAEAAIRERSLAKLLKTEATSKETLEGNGPHPIAQSSVVELSKEGPYGKQAKAVVFGNAEFARNTNIQQAANADLILNSFNYLVDSKEGLVIRPKSWTPSTLKIAEETKRGVYFASIFLLPMIIILMGLSIWNFRRSRV